MNISKGGAPRARPTATVSSARPPIAQSSQLENRAILRVSGVASSGALAIRPAMRPVSVASPVAMTSPAPCPERMVAPA
jgi:hypothetical protein